MYDAQEAALVTAGRLEAHVALSRPVRSCERSQYVTCRRARASVGCVIGGSSRGWGDRVRSGAGLPCVNWPIARSLEDLGQYRSIVSCFCGGRPLADHVAVACPRASGQAASNLPWKTNRDMSSHVLVYVCARGSRSAGSRATCRSRVRVRVGRSTGSRATCRLSIEG